MAEDSLYIGSRLRSARRKQKIKISRVVTDLCIPKRYINAFEKNDMSQFPTNAYAVGFLKNYADYLGLDQAPLVRDLKNHLREEDLDFHICRPMASTSPPSWVARAAVVGLIVLVVSGIYFGWAYLKGNDYKVAQDEEIPAHLAAFLAGDDQVQVVSQQSFQNLAGSEAKVRVVAFVDAMVKITDAAGKILHQGWIYSGEGIHLPHGADLHIFTADFSALKFYLGDVLVTPEFIKRGGTMAVALDSLKPALDAIVPTG